MEWRKFPIFIVNFVVNVVEIFSMRIYRYRIFDDKILLGLCFFFFFMAVRKYLQIFFPTSDRRFRFAPAFVP